ncbi:uncharacterized protein ACBT57_023713 isoform 3-T5 [Dama dama]
MELQFTERVKECKNRFHDAQKGTSGRTRCEAVCPADPVPGGGYVMSDNHSYAAVRRELFVSSVTSRTQRYQPGTITPGV